MANIDFLKNIGLIDKIHFQGVENITQLKMIINIENKINEIITLLHQLPDNITEIVNEQIKEQLPNLTFNYNPDTEELTIKVEN